MENKNGILEVIVKAIVKTLHVYTNWRVTVDLWERSIESERESLNQILQRVGDEIADICPATWNAYTHIAHDYKKDVEYAMNSQIRSCKNYMTMNLWTATPHAELKKAGYNLEEVRQATRELCQESVVVRKRYNPGGYCYKVTDTQSLEQYCPTQGKGYIIYPRGRTVQRAKHLDYLWENFETDMTQQLQNNYYLGALQSLHAD
jgi:hypothetical protein